MAPSFNYSNGKLVTRYAGEYTPGSFLSTWARGSARLKTPFNDIRIRNIGKDNIIFDPSKHVIQQGLEWTAAGMGVTAGALLIYNNFGQ